MNTLHLTVLHQYNFYNYKLIQYKNGTNIKNRKKKKKERIETWPVVTSYITDNKNDCHVCSIIANKGKQNNQKCTILFDHF